MSMVNRAAGRSGKNVKIDNTVSVAKQQITITENVKNTEKEKKQPTPDQIRLVSLISDKGETQSREILEKLNKIKDVTCKTDDEIAAALHDCDNNEEAAISYLLEGKADGWLTTKKKKKNRAASASKNDTAVNNFKENTDNSDDWDKDTSTNTANQSDKSTRGYRGRRGGGPRQSDRGSYNKKWRGRENKENERNAEDGSSNNAPSGRDFRGRGDRVMNGPSRLGRGGRGSRGGRGPGGSRTFQSRDNNDRGGSGFPRNIDTWNNPETENTISKNDEFPSPEDWDNEEYTGSLADSKVFTPSTTVEPETVDSAPVIESEIKEESLSLQMSIQSSPSAPIQSMVAGNNQLTPAERQYFNQLTAQASENRQKQAQQQVQATGVPQSPQQPGGISAAKTPSPAQQQPSSVIYNSSITSPQQPFTAPVTQSFASVSQSTYQSVTAAQQPQPAYNAMVSSQTFQQSPSASYQSPSSISGTGSAASYSRPSSEYTSSNFSDVINNYNSMQCVGLQTNGSLPQRSKPQRPTSRQETPTKVMPGSVDMPSTEGSIAIKYLDAQFSAALDFNSTDNFDSTATGADQSSVTAALTNKYSQNVAANAPPHGDLPSINSFQASQQPKPNLPSSNITSVLNQTTELASDASLQNDNSVYSSQTITNSRMAPGIQDLKSTSEVASLPYGISEAYQSQQQPQSFQKSTNVSQTFRGSTYGPSTPITTTASNVYSGQQQQQASQPTQQQQSQQQASQPPQQQSQISGSGSTGAAGVSGSGATGAGTAYSTSSTSFSVYSSNSHSVATATPPLHNSVYHNSSYHPSVTGSFPSYLSYPGSLMQPYQTAAAGLTQGPYLASQYGGGSLPSLGATYGAAPFHSNYGVSSNLQTPVATLQQTHKISNSLSTSAAGTKDNQYDNLQTITSASSNTANTTSGNVISGLSQPSSTTTSAKVTSSSTSGSKSSGMLPSIPPGVAPLLGPQYIMSQGTLPLYQPAFTLNYDDLQYLQRGMHPPVPAGYLDLNYAAAPQTNLAAAGRDALSVPFSTISDVRFPRPDNTTSPVPPAAAAAAAAGASLSQQNTAPTHQQPQMPLLQTYAAAYIYPSYQQYTTPVYQVAPTATPAAPGSSNNAALAATPFAKAPTGYNSTGYASQYESLANNQANVGDYSKGNSASTYSNSQQPSKANANASNVSGQNANSGSSDLSMYGKSHASLTKSYDKQTFHSGTPPPFNMAGSGPTSSNLGNVPNVSAAAGYGPQLFIPSVPSAAAAHQQHHLHQNAHHQDGGDIRNSGTSERNYFLSSNRSTYR